MENNKSTSYINEALNERLRRAEAQVVAVRALADEWRYRPHPDGVESVSDWTYRMHEQSLGSLLGLALDTAGGEQHGEKNSKNVSYVALDTLRRGDEFVLEMSNNVYGPFVMARHSVDDMGITTVECWKRDETRSTRNLRYIVMVVDNTIGFIV